jgi:hypothetical protein
MSTVEQLRRSYGPVASVAKSIKELGLTDSIYYPFVWQIFIDFSYMQASEANLEALYHIELGVKASGQCGCSAARALAPH